MPLKVVFFDHQKFFHRLRAYFKLQGSADSFQFKKLRAELILNKSHGLSCFLANFTLWLSDLEEDLIILCVSDLEVDKLNAIDVIFRLT